MKFLREHIGFLHYHLFNLYFWVFIKCCWIPSQTPAQTSNLRELSPLRHLHTCITNTSNSKYPKLNLDFLLDLLFHWWPLLNKLEILQASSVSPSTSSYLQCINTQFYFRKCYRIMEEKSHFKAIKCLSSHNFCLFFVSMIKSRVFPFMEYFFLICRIKIARFFFNIFIGV